MSEQRRIETLSRIFAAAGAPGVVLGIGDDAAIVDVPPGRKLVVSIDEQIEGTHFRRDLASAEDIGFRATMAAASDLAAMGAEPLAIVAALALPGALDDDAFDALARGQRAAADAIGCSIVGGNLARSAALALTTTVLGTVGDRVLKRSGARAGDGIYVAGALGLASLGFEALVRGEASFATDAARAAWKRPVARIAEGKHAVAIAHAGIDVSDGLAKDLGALCTSSGIAADLDERALRELARETGALDAANALGVDVLSHVLGGGEDYALVVACASDLAGFRRIGTFHDTAEPGVFVVLEGGRRERARGGFDHFV